MTTLSTEELAACRPSAEDKYKQSWQSLPDEIKEPWECAWIAARAEGAKEIADLKAQVEGLESALDQIRSWCRAYPLAIFTEPDWNEVREKLGDILLTRVSGSNMRHVVDGVQKIIDEAIAQEKQNG